MNAGRKVGAIMRESRIFVVALAVAAVAMWAHAPCLQGGFLSGMDDDVYLAAAKHYGGLTAAGAGWAVTETHPYYQPLPRLTHLLAYSLWGERPAGQHAVNLVLHAVNAALSTLLAWTLLGFCRPSVRAPAARTVAGIAEKAVWRNTILAGFVGLVFAVHPLQAESVAWLAGCTQLISALLTLGCVLAYVHAAATGHTGWRVVAGGLFAMAWLAKPIVATLPVVLLVLDWFPLRRHVTLGWRRLVREKLWMFVVSGGFTVVTLCSAADTTMVVGTQEHGLALRMLVAERAVVFYLVKLVWPVWLSPFYPLSVKITLAQAEFFVPALVLTAACLGVWWMRRRVPALVAAWLAYLALLLPVSGLAQFGGESVSNRHMYVAMLPLLLVGAGAVSWLWQRAAAVGRVGLVALVGAALVYLTGRARIEVRMWRDDETLWRNVLRWYPDYDFANWMVAKAAVARRDFVTARPCAELLAQIHPDDRDVCGLLGLVYLKTQQYGGAIQVLQPLVQADVWLPAARYNLACAYARLGSNDAAIATLCELLPREPRFVGMAQRDPELAGIRLDPRFAAAIPKPLPSANFGPQRSGEQ